MFSLKYLGDLHQFLGIEVHPDATSLFLTQTQYIQDILFKFGMSQCKPCPTPLSTSRSISLYDGKPLNNLTVYRSAIGALQYLRHTRPVIAFVVNK